MTPSTWKADELLGPHGPLARRISGFGARAVQQQMAARVEQVLARAETLIVEAGTGTGKTFAYLVPALMAGGRVIVSTGTRTLQDQLYHRDLPLVRDALGLSTRIALLKGRANYLCPHRLEITMSEGRLRSRSLVSQLQAIRAWAGRTRSGDIAEVEGVPEDSSLWSSVTSTVDNCLGQECPAYGECFVVKARREAQEADLVVINHHLLFADMALKEEGFGDLLPGADAFILDEAHQLPEVAAQFFGISLSARQLLELGRDTRAEQLQEAGDMGEVEGLKDRLDHAVGDFRLSLGSAEQRLAWDGVMHNPKVQGALKAMQEALAALGEWLESAAPRSKGLDNCRGRCLEFIDRLDRLVHPVDASYIHWLDVYRRSFTLHLTPLDVAAAFRGNVEAQPAAWIFTSATLAVGERFDHFARRLGLEGAQTERLDSPFDYARNALLYVPQEMPDPADARYTTAVLDAALPVIAASRGRAFLLFTSYRALRFAAEQLRDRLTFPLLVQGEAPRGQLLGRFRELGDAVLLGTGSFWEGVDVRGPALSCVVIDKLPFASPSDPVVRARIESMRRHDDNPFTRYQLPSAVIALKQGVGRLIRDVEDRGVMMLCDPRLYTRPYGAVFLNSLPAMRRTRRLADVEAFFEREWDPDPVEP